MLMKLQDFAVECGVTDRTIQKHLKNHEEALAGHFERRGPNGTWLDNYAQEYIKDLMIRPVPTVVSDARLVQENKELQEANSQQEAIIAEKDLLINKLLEEVARLNATVGRLEGSEAAHKLLVENIKEEVEKANQQVDKAHWRLEKSHMETRKAMHTIGELKEQLARQEAREEAIMNRGLLARILNKEVGDD